MSKYSYIYVYIAKNDDQIATHFYYFLEQFYNLHTNYRTSSFTSSSTSSSTEGVRYTTRPLYLTGESHAGHYIPYLTSYILNKNKNKDIHILYNIDIHGIALGNPWISPYHQYDVSEFVHSYGLISLEQRYKLLGKLCMCVYICRLLSVWCIYYVKYSSSGRICRCIISGVYIY